MTYSVSFGGLPATHQDQIIDNPGFFQGLKQRLCSHNHRASVTATGGGLEDNYSYDYCVNCGKDLKPGGSQFPVLTMRTSDE